MPTPKKKKKVNGKARSPAKKAAPKKGPRNLRLPGMEDAKLADLHEAALSYAEIRDQCQELTKQEVELKTELLSLMHKHGKDTYSYNGVSVELIHESETVKVRIKKAKTDADDEPSETDLETPPAVEANI